MRKVCVFGDPSLSHAAQDDGVCYGVEKRRRQPPQSKDYGIAALNTVFVNRITAPTGPR